MNSSEWLWHRDDQVCYTKYLIAGHNSLVKIDRSNNEGQYTAFYEAADELDGLEGVQIRPALFTEADDDVYPSDDNFIPNDFKDVLEQAPPAPSEIALAYLT